MLSVRQWRDAGSASTVSIQYIFDPVLLKRKAIAFQGAGEKDLIIIMIIIIMAI